MKFGYILAIGLAEVVSGTWNLMPRATDGASDKVIDGFSPVPTGHAYDLAKALDPKYSNCGYIDGDARTLDMRHV
jgi:hypothetical protein